MRKQIKVNAMSFAILVREMLAAELTCEELAEQTGLHYVTVLHYTREMHKAGSAYIAAWRMNHLKQYVLKVYGVGSRADVDKPRKAMTPAQRTQKYRAKLKRKKAYEQRVSDQSAALQERGDRVHRRDQSSHGSQASL
jgi:hypothetical protein